MPKQVVLKLHLPESLIGGSRCAFVTRLTSSVTEAEAKAANQRAISGRSIVGRAFVRRQHWNDSPTSREPRRQLDPRVACKNT